MHKWDDKLWLLTPKELEQLPDGFVLKSILGNVVTKGIDYIDDDTRFGHLAYGVENPHTHPESELLLKIMLS